MNKFGFAFVLIVFAFVQNAFVSSQDYDMDVFLMSDSLNKTMIESLYSKLEANMDIIQEFLPESDDEEMSPAVSLVLQKFISSEYGDVIAHLARDDEFSYMIKMAAIRSAADSTMEKMSGSGKKRFVDQLMDIIEEEVQLQKQKSSLEHNELSQ